MAREVAVGLDVGSRSVKVVQLAKQKESYSLLNAAMDEFDHGADEKSRIAVIKKVIKQSRIKMKEVNISIEGPSVIIRNIEFPKMSPDELKKAIKFEAEKYIPYKVSEVVLDCEILKESEHNMTVLLAAAKKDFIYTKINFIRKAGLEPWIVDIDSCALINAFNLNVLQEGKTIALVNVGDRITNVNIINDGVLIFTRNIALGGYQATMAISGELSIDEKEAELLKHGQGEKREDVANTCQNTFKELSAEIKSSFDYYENQYEQAAEGVYISGGVAESEEFKKYLSESLGLEVQRWNPFKNINLSSRISKEELERISCFAPIAVGLALRKV